MARWKGTLLGGGIGWAFGGPLGAIIGAFVGNLVEGAASQAAGQRTGAADFTNRPGAGASGAFAVSLLVLFASVVKADRKILAEEVKFVKEYLIRQFGTRNAQELMPIFRDCLEKDYDLREVCLQIDSHLNYHSKLEMLHILFGIAIADRHLHELELKAIHQIAAYLSISDSDFNSIKAIFVKDENQSYKILGLESSATDEEIKKAYRDLAMKYHPDRIHDLGDDFKKVAEEKFKAVNNAYQEIKRQRGF